MTYLYTPEEARPIANVVFKFMQSRQFTVSIEKALNDDAPCRTTLIAEKAGLNILFEAQNEVNCDEYLRTLVLWLNNNCHYAELFIVSHRGTNFSGYFFRQLDQAGIGLMIVEDNGKLTIERQPRNPALIVSPAPTLKFGKYKQYVMAFLAKFNQPNSFLSPDTPRKDALRDVCELVEGLTEDVAITAAKKGYLLRDEQTIQQMTWSNRINVLAAPNAYAPNYSPFVTEELKTDLHSFRNGRNLVDHRVRSKREEVQRQQKFQDRMITGVRLVADLVSLKTKIARKKKLSP